MRLFYFRGEKGVANFGDELNQYIWPRLLPGAFDDDEATQFVGIGTLLNDRLPAAPRTIVFGSGVGYYGPPRAPDSWSIYCVRGPLSARALGLSPDTGITDPAVLITTLIPPRTTGAPASRWPRAFMPHWQSEPDAWKDVCEGIGMPFIDPRSRPEDVLDALGRTDLLITEAMHGAIVADALRIPWIPVRTRDAINSFKWEDWCRSLELDYCPHQLPTLWPEPPGAGVIARTRRRAKLSLASSALARIARRARPVLSDDRVLGERLCTLQDRLEQLKRDDPSLRASVATAVAVAAPAAPPQRRGEAPDRG